MPARKADISAKDFVSPLLSALGELSQYMPGTEIGYEATYAPIFSQMGINPQEYGQTEQGVFQAERWVQFAFNQLCDKGLATRLGRGKWALTPEGAKAAMAAMHEKPQPETTLDETSHVSLPIGPGLPTDTYHEDPYIRGLAAQKTPCLGAYSPHAPTCSTCPLQKACANVVAVSLSNMAKEFQAQDKTFKILLEKSALTPETKPDPVTPVTPSGTANFEWVKRARIDTVNASVPTQCRYCGVTLERGSSVIWAHVVGSPKEAAMFHKNCHAVIKKEWGI